MNTDVILGWVLGVAGSIISGIVLFWLQGRRDAHLERLRQRREDVRIARNWAQDGKKASLRSFDLAGENLSGKDLASADLEEANLEKARLYNTVLHHANLIHANFRGAKLVGVNFREANLLGADFTGAILRRVDFTEARLQKAKLRQAKIEEPCNWTAAVIDDSTEIGTELRNMFQAASVSATSRPPGK